MLDLYKNLGFLNKKETSISNPEIEKELAKILVELENNLMKKIVNKVIVKEFGKEMPLLADKVYKRLPST
jgi:hypothetical protein